MGDDFDHLEPFLLRPADNYDLNFSEFFSLEADDIFSLISSASTSSSSSSELSKDLGQREGKIKKQKTRALRKNPRSSFFMTEPENFRVLVQEMTGLQTKVRSPAPERKPQRAAPPVECAVPTLDTSALWLESLRVNL